MRVGIDCRLWNETGIGRYIRNLVEQLGKIDNKNQYVLFLRKSEYNSVSLPYDNFEKRIADIRWHSVKEQLLFSRILNKENLDLVHFPYFSVPIFYNKPFVITIHDLILNHFDTGKASTLPYFLYKTKRLGYNYVLSHAIKNAQKIIAVSNTTKKEIVDHYDVDKSKIEVTYEGFDSKINSSNKHIVDGDYFLYVGNAYPHKNLDFLLEAFRIFHEQSNNIKLVLVGKEDYFYKKISEKIKELSLDSSVQLFGYATDDQLSSLYKNAKALIFPSKMEGFGLPILEALANNCLVIASDIQIAHEIGDDSLVYFDLNSELDLKNKMIDVLSWTKKDKEAYLKKGKEQIQKFSWEKMAKETLSVYNSSHV